MEEELGKSLREHQGFLVVVVVAVECGGSLRLAALKAMDI